VREDCKRGRRENCGEDCATVTINFLGPLRLLVVIQDCRHQNLNQGKEDKQRAREKKGIEARHVRQARQLAINRETVSNQCKHGCNCDADLRVGRGWINPENGPRHHHNKNEGKNHFQNVMLHIAGGGELEDIARVFPRKRWLGADER